MAGQGRLGDKANASADAHGCPGCPHPVTGPGISGSPNVFVNKRPALRMSDRGIHAACCAGNTWVAQVGSATVFINGKAAHRVGDATFHCGGMGKLIEGSDNVLVGDGGGAGAGAPPLPSLRAFDLPKVAMPGRPFVMRLGPLAIHAPSFGFPGLPPPISPAMATRIAHAPGVASAIVWTIDGKPCPERGRSVSVTFGREHAGRHIPITARLGKSSIETLVAVPKLTIAGPEIVEVKEQIELVAQVTPHVAGKYAWYDARGKRIGEGQKLKFTGEKRSKERGDQPVECRFSPKDGASTLSEKHPITVEKIPRLTLPINISLGSLAETVRWLRDNPIEVSIDNVIAGSHAMVESAGRIVVSFGIKEGEHEVVVSSGAANWAAGRQRIRLVHFSNKIKVTPKDD